MAFVAKELQNKRTYGGGSRLISGIGVQQQNQGEGQEPQRESQEEDQEGKVSVYFYKWDVN